MKNLVLVGLLMSAFIILAALSITTGETTHYAEGYYHSYDSPFLVDIVAADTYYNITNMTIDNSNGIITQDFSVKITKAATYRVIGTMSFSGGNGGEYELELFVNDEEQEDCAFLRTTNTTAIGDATLACIIDLNVNDLLVMKIKDISALPQDVSVYALNFNIVEVV